MKNAYIISNSEMVGILREHLSNAGFDTSGLTVRFTSTNAVVAGISRAEEADGPNSFDDEKAEESDFSMVEAVREEIASKPMTIAALAAALNATQYEVRGALAALNAQSVAPAREDGCTVSMWMLPGTDAYEQFVADEKARIDEQVEKWENKVGAAVPKFYQKGAERPQVVENICENLSPESAEELRRDAKAIFYRMAEAGKLEHREHSWRKAKTEAEEVEVTSLQGAVREVLMASDEGLELKQIADKLPGFVDGDLLRHAVRRMPDVCEQDGLLHHEA